MKKILVVGLGVSGIASIKALNEIGTSIYAYDELPREKLKERLKEIENIHVEYFFGNEEIKNIDFTIFDLAIKSPGVRYEVPIIKELLKNKIEVISDVEASYRITEALIVSVTGTNGKTTTLTLIGEILKESGKSYKLTGNIGSGMFNDALKAKKGDILLAEVSSFQLAGTSMYKPYISVITNITPDHLDYHQTMENYIESKFKNTINQNEDDYAILNYEDEIIRNKSKDIRAKKIFFSSHRVLDKGIFIEEDEIVYKDDKEKIHIVNSKDIFIPGKHSLENAMAAIGVAIVLGIDLKIIAKVFKNFKGVEHRLEYVATYEGVNFYNDSKGTNPDASIKAIQGIEKPIILIAGGYDKGSSYDDFIKSFDNKVKALILLGQTADNMASSAKKHGITNIYIVKSMDEAVKRTFELGEEGDNVLLSPACASWGLYPNYEVRGKDFKERVNYYGRNIKENKN